MVSLADRRRGAEYLEGAHAVSERRVCQVVGIARSTKRRLSGRIEEIELLAQIHALSERYPRFGYRKIFDRLKTAGWRVGRERVRLLRRREGLRVPQKAPKRRRRGTSTIDPHQATVPNHVWSYDFVADQTYVLGVARLDPDAMSAEGLRVHQPRRTFRWPLLTRSAT